MNSYLVSSTRVSATSTVFSKPWHRWSCATAEYQMLFIATVGWLDLDRKGHKRHRQYTFFNNIIIFSAFCIDCWYFFKKISCKTLVFLLLHGCVKNQTIYVHIIMLMRIVTWLSFMAICRSACNRSRSCQQISLWDVTLTNSSIPVTFTFGLFWWWGLVALCRNFLPFKKQGQASQTTLTLFEGYQKSGGRTVHPFTFGTNYYTTPTFQQIIINFLYLL